MPDRVFAYESEAAAAPGGQLRIPAPQILLVHKTLHIQKRLQADVLFLRLNGCNGWKLD